MSDIDHKNITQEISDVVGLRAQISTLESQYATLKNHSSQLTELSDTAADMMSQGSLDTLLQFIANEIVRLTNANGAYLHMVHETGDYLHVIAACGALEKQLMGNTRKRGAGLSAAAWERGTYQYTNNYNQHGDRVVEFPEELKAVAVPLIFSGQISGVAFVTSSITEDLLSQVSLLQEIAKIAALSIYYTEQLESQAHELQRIKALSILGNNLYQATGYESILDAVCNHLFTIFDLDRVTIFRGSRSDGKLHTFSDRRNVKGIIQHHELDDSTLCEKSISYWCYKHAQFAQIDRHIEDPRESAQVHAYRREHELGSTMCIPVSYNERPWGVAVVAKSIHKRNFDESDATAFHAVASQVSTALQRNNLLAKVKHQAYHDSLTGLPNRRSFEEQFSKCVKNGDNKEYAVLFCDLDGFKTVNDSHGHGVGDKVINVCAARMVNCIRDSDYLARMGGDEFAVLVNLMDFEHDIDILAKRFVAAISEPISVDGLRINIGLSVGISFYPKDGETFSELLNHADVAMYQAKHAGKGKILHFNKKDFDEIRAKNELRASMRGSLQRNEFELWYQPQVAWQTGKVVGVEALVRWNHPQNGIISPFEFIPIAEESGFIDPLGLWIMEEAVSALKAWKLYDNHEFCMGVNIAPPQFIDPEFSSNVLSILEQHNISPTQLKVEITESFIMSERESVVRHLKQLREQGVVVAIDDFGTGYSSLSYLQDLPLDVLKIDRAFVNALNQDNYKTSIAASIIALANSLGLSTITEGVESDEQLEFIKQLGSDVIQGYYFSKPVPASELLSTIASIETGGEDMKIKVA